MPPERIRAIKYAHTNQKWQVYKLLFDRSLRQASIRNLEDDMLIISLPRQDRATAGFQIHRNSLFSPELSSYLRYLQTNHILLHLEYPEISHLADTDNEDDEDDEDDWNSEGAFRYHTLLFHLPGTMNTNPYVGFSFIDDQLYSGMYLEVKEIK